MKKVKLVVFVPLTHTKVVREALGKSGAGTIGDYSHCSFSSIGTGRFKPNTKAKPYIGKANSLESVQEERIEITCLKKEVKKIIEEMKKVHPYEEIAFDIYPLINEEDL